MNDDPLDNEGALRRALLTLLPVLALAENASAQDPAAVQPQSYRVTLDNERLRVLDFLGRPGMGVCGVGMHSHPAHLTVALTPARVRVRTPEGRTMVVENKPGDVFWSEAETHSTENLLGHDVRALVVELKGNRS